MTAKTNEYMSISDIARVFLDGSFRSLPSSDILNLYEMSLYRHNPFGVSHETLLQRCPQHFVDLLKQLQQASQNPDDEKSKNFLDSCQLLVDALIKHNGDYMRILFKKIDLIQDVDVVHDVLKHLISRRNELDTKTRQDAAFRLISLPNATSDDYVDALSFLKPSSELNKKVLNDAFKQLDIEISAELSKIRPNTTTINDLLSTARYFIDRLADTTGHPQPELREKYKYENIMANPTPEYIQKFDDSILSKLQESKTQQDAEVEKLHKSQEEKDAEIEKLRSEMAELKRQKEELSRQMTDLRTRYNERITQQDAEIRDLHQQISSVNVELNKTRQEANQRKAKIMELSSAIMSIKGGLGARGVKEAQAIATSQGNTL